MLPSFAKAYSGCPAKFHLLRYCCINHHSSWSGPTVVSNQLVAYLLSCVLKVWKTNLFWLEQKEEM